MPNKYYNSTTGEPKPELVTILAKLTGGKPWAKNGKYRVYFDGGDEYTCYLNFDAGATNGAHWTLTIYIPAQNMAGTYYKDIRTRVTEQHKMALRLALGSYYLGMPHLNFSGEVNADFRAMAQEFFTAVDNLV